MIDAKGKSRIFVIIAGVKVTIKNLKLTNGNGISGAIYCKSNLSVSDCTFTNNQGVNGGAILSGNSSFSVSDCTFTNNQATMHGGAINIIGGTGSVSDCTFTNNQASQGGAIYVSDGNFGCCTSTVSDCIFTNNQANMYGGAICSNGTFGCCTSTVSDCIFTNNQATMHGGAIYIEYGTIRLNSVVFKYNIAGGNYNVIYLGSEAEVYKNKLTIIPAVENIPVFYTDLTIAKITKKGNYCYVNIKNIGNKGIDNSFYLSVYVGKKQIQKVLVKSIGVGKSTSVKVSIAKKYRNSLKTFKADCTNRIKEMNESNNSLKAR